MFVFRTKYFVLAILLFLVEVYIAAYMHDRLIRPYGGDFLVVIMLYCFIRTFINKPVMFLAITVLLISCLVEWTQYYGLIYKMGWEHSLLAHLIIGSTFKWLDIVMYIMGVSVVVLLEKLNLKKTPVHELRLKS